MPLLNWVLSLEMSSGCLNYSSHGAPPSLLAVPAPAGTQPAQAVWLLKAGFVISAMQQLLPRWQDPTLAHMPILVKGSQDGVRLWMQSTGGRQHGCQSSPQDAHTRGIPGQRPNLVCSALIHALCKRPLLPPCLLLTQQLHTASYPCTGVYIWFLLHDDLPRREAVINTSPLPCHSEAGVSHLVVRAEEEDEGTICDQAANGPISVFRSQCPAPATRSPDALTKTLFWPTYWE